MLSFSLFAESTLKIEKIMDNGYSAIASGGGVEVGQSGVVLEWLNSDRRAVVAKAVVVGVSGTQVAIKFEVFSDVAQDSLPKYIALPKVGDDVVFGLFDSRALVVAKNQSDYLKAITLVNKQLIHPDLFAFRLYKNRKGVPTKEYFTSFCSDYSVADVYFAVEDKLYKVDCGSMNVISSEPFTPSGDKSYESPFFHRLGTIETGYLGFYKESVPNYEDYYKKLLGVR